MNINPWIAGLAFACVALPLLFGLILKGVSVLGGWSELARSYRTTEPTPYPRMRMQSADLRKWCGYGNVLTLATDGEALFMSLPFPFGFGHPKLRLPWSEAQVEQSTHWFGIKTTTLTFERAPNTAIRFKRATAEQLIDYARQARDRSAGEGVTESRRSFNVVDDSASRKN